MKHLLIFVIFLSGLQNVTAQITLTIKQVGINGDSLPVLELVDYESSKYERLNDSTLTYTLNPKHPESLFIGIDPKSGWFTRIWIDPAIKHKELTLNYSTEASTIKNPDETDKLFEKVFSFLRVQDRTVPDSIMMAFVEKNPDSYLSLYFVSHGLYRNNPPKRLAALNGLSPQFQDEPDYKRTKASLLERKFSNVGDQFKEFSLFDVNDNIFNSVAISNKWILLHFWSNGCGPCVKKMDTLVSCYNSLDTSKITFISVAVDSKQEQWKNAKTTHKIKWTSVWQPNGSTGDLCLHYNVSTIPFYVLFNNEKKIELVTFGDEIPLIKEKLISLGLHKTSQ
jgi:hypothetical protein